MVNRRSNVRITTVVIGKKILALFLFFILFTVFIMSAVLVITNTFSYDKTGFHVYNVGRAIPVVGVKSDYSDGLKKVIQNFTGLYPGEHIYNFSVLPYFYKNGELETENNIAVYYEEQPAKAVNATVPVVKIDEQNYVSKSIEIKNETTYNVDTKALLNMENGFQLNHDGPEILIVHTHGTESYTQSEKYNYSSKDSARCTDNNYNVVRVGDELQKELEKYGYRVLHDKTLNDYPSYNSSYTKTLGLIEKYLEEYPSIKCVFDVHRDAIEKEDGTKVKFTAQIGDEKVSQVMIVCGSDGLGLENADWQQNLGFALKIQNYLNGKYPGFMRPVNLRKERFNLHKTKGSLIFEVGTHGNTLDEAIGSCKYLAEGINAVLK